MNPARLVLRADASPAMGTGHVMRCLALAEAWRETGGSATLLAANLPPALAERAAGLGVDCQPLAAPPGGAADAAETAAAARAPSAAWVVVDGYHFPAAYQRHLREAGLRVLWVDDFGCPDPLDPALLLNQNLGASRAWYPRLGAGSEALLSPRYALLRREFLRWQEWRRGIPPRAEKLLVTLGGSDPANATRRVVDALRLLGGAAPRATLVAGGSNPHFDELARALAGLPHQLLRQTSEMPALMAGADLAIAAGGTTAWELAFLGLPALLFCLADNQRNNCRELARHGVAVDLGAPQAMAPERLAEQLLALAEDAPRRAAMSAAGRALVDGWGAWRVGLHLREPEVRFRPATPADARQLFEWFNDPAVRAVSFSGEKVSWKHHLAWFTARLRDPAHLFWLAEDGAGRLAGQVRFTVVNETATISISLDPAARGRGLGTLLIWAACRRLRRERPGVTRIEAWIKPDNDASLRAFRKAGFTHSLEQTLHGQPAKVLTWNEPPP